MADGDTNVRVAVRFRPLNDRERAINDTSCAQINGNQIALSHAAANASDEKNFAFDFIFDENSLQTEVWDAIGVPILAKAFSGYNGTIFAYGQTGSGEIIFVVWYLKLIRRCALQAKLGACKEQQVQTTEG